MSNIIKGAHIALSLWAAYFPWIFVNSKDSFGVYVFALITSIGVGGFCYHQLSRLGKR